MGPAGIILVNPPITTLQQSLTHSALWRKIPVECRNFRFDAKIEHSCGEIQLLVLWEGGPPVVANTNGQHGCHRLILSHMYIIKCNQIYIHF